MSTIFINNLEDLIGVNLKKHDNDSLLTKHIVKYIDKNNSKLQHMGPIEMIYCNEEDMNIVYQVCGVTEEKVLSIISEVKNTGIKAQWSNVGKPFYILLTLMIRFYKSINKKDRVKMLLLFYGVSLYPSLFFKYFKHSPNQATMEYTINNLSKKYKVKQLGTMYASILDTMEKADDTGERKLIKGVDEDILIYIQDKKTRLNDLFKNISREYYKNNEKQKYLNYDFDNFDEENFHESKSNMYEINKITDKITLKMVVEGPDMRLINASAKINQVSVNELRNYINTLIISDNREQIHRLVELILSLFLLDPTNNIDEIRSDKFLRYCLELYKKSNTNNKNIIEIKQILDKWLVDVGLHDRTSRIATINSFRKALFTFFVFSIEKNS